MDIDFCIKNLEVRNDIPISNQYELINKSIDDFHYVIYYVEYYKIKLIIRRLDEADGWGVDLKLKIYDMNFQNYQILSLGSSEKNCKIIEIYTNIKVEKVIYNIQDIPKVIIQTTFTKYIKNILHFNAIMTFIELNPEYEYKIFDNDEVRLFIKKNFNRETLTAYDLIIPGAFKADFFRYCYLYINGGCYFDCKQILRTSLRNIINKNDTFLICKDAGDGYFNALIFPIPKNDLLLKTINVCVSNIYNYYKIYDFYNSNRNKYNDTNTILSFTGPILFYNTIKKYVNNSNIKFIHKFIHNKKIYFNHDYQRLYIEYNSNIIITKAYNQYFSSSGDHYSHQWYRREVVYKYIDNHYNQKLKFYNYIMNDTDTFCYEILSEKELLVTRIDKDEGWADNIKLKIINEENNSELLLNISSPDKNSKIIYSE
jgi:mannosyltransferase OCH1-like enzyme